MQGLARVATALVVTLCTPLAPAQTPDPKAKAKADKKAAAKSPAQPVVGRDWTKIDTNKDGYISPDEMEIWLKANSGPDK